LKRMKFEEALQQLEAIVDKLETGDMDLEESIALYEEGINLSVYCQKQLTQAEGRIQRLVKKMDGDVEVVDI
jgi:exodeoxyribonuclease VII small subunit